MCRAAPHRAGHCAPGEGVPPHAFGERAFLSTGVNGSQPGQTFTVTYTDGSSDSFTQDMSDWLAPQGYAGESVAAALPYRNQSGGTTDGTANDLYLYSFHINPGKTVSSITLPANGNVLMLAIDLIV